MHMQFGAFVIADAKFFNYNNRNTAYCNYKRIHTRNFADANDVKRNLRIIPRTLIEKSHLFFGFHSTSYATVKARHLPLLKLHNSFKGSAE